MTEPISEFTLQEDNTKRILEKYISLAETLSKKTEGFQFSRY